MTPESDLRTAAFHHVSSMLTLVMIVACDHPITTLAKSPHLVVKLGDKFSRRIRQS
jgi:Txe/YoeB family toxin of Txe-Axe toxin-antitoxin module